MPVSLNLKYFVFEVNFDFDNFLFNAVTITHFHSMLGHPSYVRCFVNAGAAELDCC